MDTILAYRPRVAAVPVRGLAVACASACIAVICPVLAPIDFEHFATFLLPRELPLLIKLIAAFLMFPALLVGPPLLNALLLRALSRGRKLVRGAILLGLMGPVVVGLLMHDFQLPFNPPFIPLLVLMMLAFPCGFVLLMWGRSAYERIQGTAGTFLAYLQRVGQFAAALGILEFVVLEGLPRFHEFCRDAHVDSRFLRFLWSVAAIDPLFSIPICLVLGAAMAAFGIPRRPRRVRFGRRSGVVWAVAAIAAAMVAEFFVIQ